MEQFQTIISFIILILIIFLSVWVGKILISLKNAVSAQKDVIDSFKSQTDYIKNIQEVVKNLYNPDDIENIIHIKTQVKIEEQISLIKDDSKKIMKSYDFLLDKYKVLYKDFYTFASQVAIYISDDKLHPIIEDIEDKDTKESITEITQKTKNDLFESIRLALENRKQA